LFAASFAARHPDRVTALALLSPAIGYNVPAGASLPAAVQARIDEIGALGPAAFAARRAARLVGSPEHKSQIVAAVEAAMAQVDPAGYAQAVRALGAGHLLADAPAITAPTLVAVGTADVITPPENARAVHARLKRAAGYHEIGGAGHALPQEEPAAVARLVAQLIEDAVHG
jgi:pimeloyl-ACP methyl ester carboxylesterase